MNKQSKQTLIFVAALVVFLVVILAGWEPIKAATSKVLNSWTNNRGLVGYWDFDDCDTCTIAVDRSGNGRTGSMLDNNVAADLHTPGKIGNGANFPGGANDRMRVNSNFGLTNANVTMAMWVNLPDTSQSGAFIKIGDPALSASGYGVGVGASDFDGNGNDLIMLYEGLAWFDTNVLIGTGWHHIAMVIDSANDPIGYIDGSRVFSANHSPTAPSDVTDIGGYTISGIDRYADHKLDEVRVYNRALSDAELKTLYRAGIPARVGIQQKSASNTGLVGHWNFDDCDTCTTALDRSGNGNNGTLQTSCVNTAGDLHTSSGLVGNAVSLNGSSDCVEIASSASLEPSSQLTISAWVKPNSGTLNALREIFRKEDASNRILFSFQNSVNCASAGTGGCVSFGINTTGYAELDVAIDSANWEGAWHHVVASYDGSNKVIYQDGREIGRASASGLTTGTGAKLYIGSDRNFELFSGAIDEVRFYNRGLSAAEVQALFAEKRRFFANVGQNNRFRDGLVGFWSFNGPDVSGTTATDRSGGAADGTLVGGPVVAPGVIGQALSFDGIDDNVNIGDGIDPANVTLTAWVKPGDLGLGRHIISKWSASAIGTRQYVIATDDDAANHFLFVVNVGAGYDECDSNTSGGAFQPGQWVFIAGTYDGSTCKIYINGVDSTTLVSDSASGSIDNEATDLRIGIRGDDSASPFFGLIDEPRIYNRALSAAEIAEIYRAGNRE